MCKEGSTKSEEQEVRRRVVTDASSIMADDVLNPTAQWVPFDSNQRQDRLLTCSSINL